MLYCVDSETEKPKNKKKLILFCSDYSNNLLEIIIWENHEKFDFISEINVKNNLLKIENAYFNEFRGKTNLTLNSYSKLKIISFDEVQNAN